MTGLHDHSASIDPHCATVKTPRELGSALAAPAVQAVFLDPGPAEPWEQEVAAALQTGRLAVPRTILAGLAIDGAASWLERNIPRNALGTAARDGLLSGILELFHLQEEISGAETFRFRIHTDTPDRRCGFHVDTVAPGLPVWGILRVFNGNGTLWVDPANIRSMAAFFEWLQRRDRAVRLSGEDQELPLAELDEAADFLVDASAIRIVPAGTTIIFRHLDVSRHWSERSPDAAWVHSSPMEGGARLVVNITADRPRPHVPHS